MRAATYLPSLLAVLALTQATAAASERLTLALTQIDLPGAPVSVLPVDIDRDGIGDLAIVVAYTEWDQIAIEESVELDQVEGLLEMMTVVPALADRRELHVFLGSRDGLKALPPEPLDLSVLTLAAGPPGEPLIALTDAGIAAVRIVEPEARAPLELRELRTRQGPRVRLVPLVETRSVLSGTRALLPDLGITVDIDKDGSTDVLVPRIDRITVYRGTGRGFDIESAVDVDLPPRKYFQRRPTARRYPLPLVQDVDGDQRPDLVFRAGNGWKRFWVARALPSDSFAELIGPLGSGALEIPLPSPDAPVSVSGSSLYAGWDDRSWSTETADTQKESDSQAENAGIAESAGTAENAGDSAEDYELVYFGDLTGDGRAEYVLLEDLSSQDAGFRKEMKQAKRPPVRFHIYPSKPDLTRAQESLTSFLATGYAFPGEDETPLPGGFLDLDGDQRKDLVTLTLDFSLLQALRVVATRSLSIGLDFHLWCQRDDGSFRRVEGLDLSGKFKLRLDDLRLGQLSQFAGDFDGDGRIDFVQMGRGKDVSIHRGSAGCRYPSTPDLTLKLADQPVDLGLVRVGDYDLDNLSDLLIIQPLRSKKNGSAADGATAPVRIDLYSSRGSQ